MPEDSQRVAARSSRKYYLPSAAVGTALLGAGCAIVAVWALAGYGIGRPTSYDTLIATVGTSRPVEGRLARFPYSPFQSKRGSERAERPSAAQRLAAATLASEAEKTPTAAHLHEYGVASLVIGDVDSAIEALERAAADEGTRSASIQNDLAVAYLARASRHERLEDLLFALRAATRALRVSPDHAEATFNLAIALERLHLDDSAREAWGRHLEGAPAAEKGWQGEARRRQAALLERASSPTQLRTVFEYFDSTADRDDVAATRAFAATHPEAARTYLEERLPLRWIEHPSQRARFVAHAELIAQTPAWRDDSHMRDLVAWLAASSDTPALADALRRFAAAAALIREDRYSEVGAELATAPAVLAAARSPLAPIAAYYEVMPAVQRGDFQAAVPRLELLKRQTEGAGYAWWDGAVLNRLGQIRGRDGDQQTAIRLRERALASFGRAGSDEQVAIMHSMIAECYRNLADLTAAWRHHAIALGKLPRVENHRSRHIVIAQAGLTAAQARLWEAGQTFQTAVIANGFRWERASGIATGYLLRARSRYKTSAVDEAKQDLIAAGQWVDKIPDRAFRERIALELLEVKGEVMATDQPDAALAALTVAVDRFLSTGFGARLGGLMWRRAEVYRRLGRSSEAVADLRTGLDRVEQERARLSEEQLRVAQSGMLRPLAHGLAEFRLADGRDEAFRLLDMPRAQTLVERLAGSPRDAAAPSRIRQALPDRTAVLHYTVLRDRVLLWEITPSSDAIHVLAMSPDALTESVRRYRRALAGDPGAGMTYEGAAEALGRALFDPVRTTLSQARTIIIVPDGYLYGVAFPSLPFEASAVLATNRDVLVVPSAAAAFPAAAPAPSSPAASARPVAAARRDVLIAGVSARGEGLAALPWIKTEVAQVKRYYPGALVLEDLNASKSGFLASLDRARIVHFAGHAASNPERPLLSRLLLAGPGGDADPLYAYEIARRDLRGAVVVLAACSTGFNDVAAEAQNEGVLSLARGFLAAGAVAVVASLVDVNDEDTGQLMGPFHAALSRGDSPVGALRTAIETLRHSGSSTSSPTWQSFIVIGTRSALGGAS